MRRSPLLTAFCFCALAASPCSAALGQGRLADQAGPQDLDATQQQQKERAKPRRVALLETEAVDAQTFLLHGCLPVPPGTYPREDGQSPFHILDGPGGQALPVQVAIVSRAPNGEADVLEVIARVSGQQVSIGTAEKDRGKTDRQRFTLVTRPAPTVEAPDIPHAVAELLAPRGPGTPRLRARDTFGHPYELNLRGSELDAGFGSRQVLKSGRYLRQTRTYGTLVCEVPFRPRRRFATIAPPLPHLFGVHAYITEYADEERISLDLRIHNGHSSGAGAPHPLETPLGLVYFDSLELVLPRGWTALPRVRDPFFGQARLEGDEVVVPLVLPLPARKNGQRPLHMIGPRGQFTRRLELVPLDPTALEESQAPLVGGARGVSGTSGAVGAAGLAFPLARAGLWSWQNPSTANFGPQRTILADWDFYRGPGGRGAGGARSADGKALESLTTLLATGQAGADSVSATVMGWAHPWFRKYQGVTGGFAIDTIGGARVAGSASQDGYRRLELLHRMNTCRQPQALYDWRGEPVGFRQWVNERGLVKVKYRSTVLGSPPSQKLPCLGGPQASVQAKAAVQANRRPEYDLGNGYLAGGAVENTDKNLLAWMPHDGQHLARYTKFAQALAWLGNDALAKDDLLLSAELYRLMVHEGLDPTRPEPEVDGVERDQVEENPEEAGAGLEPREQGAEPELRGPPKPPTPPSPRELARQAKQKEQARERATRAAERIERQESKPWPPPLPLYELEALAHKRRQGGAQVGRELAWGIDATCSAYSLGSPAWRRDSARWFRRLGAALPRLAMPTGIIQRQVNSKFFPDGSHAGAQSFESLLLVHGLRCLDASVFEGQAPGLSEALRSLALRAVDYLFFGPPWQLAAQGEKRGPARAFAVAPADPRDAAFGPAEDGSDWDLPTEAVAPEVETLYGLEALAWAALLSEGIQGSGLDNRFLQRALSYGEGAADLRELAAGVGRRAKPPARDDAGNWAGFLGHLQALGRSE